MKSNFNWWSSFALPWVDKVTTSAIKNVPVPVELLITQIDDHVKMRLISQLINDISKVLEKLLYFTKIS